MSFFERLIGGHHGGHRDSRGHGTQSRHGGHESYRECGPGPGDSSPRSPGSRPCAQCGRLNFAGARFCQECGQSLSASNACAQCAAVLVPGAKFCAQCGTARP